MKENVRQINVTIELYVFGLLYKGEKKRKWMEEETNN